MPHRRTRWLLIGAATLATAVALVVVLFLPSFGPPPSPIDPANARWIKAGMTQAEVEAILGGNRWDHGLAWERHLTGGMSPSRLRRADGSVHYIDHRREPMFLLPNSGPVRQKASQEWISLRGQIGVVFDGAGRVVEVWHRPLVKARDYRPFINRVLYWLEDRLLR